MMKKAFGVTLGGLIMLGLALPYWCGRTLSWAKSVETKISGITWEKSFQKVGRTVTPGSAQADFGRFNFYCYLDPDGQGSLVTTEPRGGGELPLKTKKLFILINDNRSATLLQEWVPLAGSKQPVKLKPIVTVNSVQLFAVLPKPDLPSVDGQVNRISFISWGKMQFKGKICYLPGKLKLKSGAVELFWQVASGQTPKLFISNHPGAGELPAREQKLYLADNSLTKTTTLYQERQPLAHQKSTACLWPVATVKTHQLLAKLAKMQK
jgi:hypothetical protein